MEYFLWLNVIMIIVYCRLECTGDTDTNFFGFLCPKYTPDRLVQSK
jgi:hypothetical protein